MSEEDKDRKEAKKKWIDVVSVISVLYMVGAYVYDFRLTSKTGSPSIWLILMLANTLPCAFGAVWLVFRYTDTIERKFPFVKSKWFLVPFVIVAPFALNVLKWIMGNT
jgi:hypothetical protein